MNGKPPKCAGRPEKIPGIGFGTGVVTVALSLCRAPIDTVMEQEDEALMGAGSR